MNTAQMHQGQLIAAPGQPIKMVELATKSNVPITEQQQKALLIGKALGAYRKSMSALLKGKYNYLAESVPSWMIGDCKIYVILCTDGVFVRYDRTEDKPSVLTSELPKKLEEIVADFSEHVIHMGKVTQTAPDLLGPKITLSRGNMNTGELSELLSFFPKLFVSTQITEDSTIQPEIRPRCLASIGNEFDLVMNGVMGPNETTGTANVNELEQFITRCKFKLPVGWSIIEVYPILDDKYWNAEPASTWAELDLLAVAVQKNLADKKYRAIDNRSAIRKQYVHLINEFENLLEGPEEPVHQFLKQHPELISPTCERFWSKLPFGNRVSDFVFRESYNDYQLVELEAPVRQLFRKDGQQREELTHAINQILDWLEYIASNKQKVENELALTGISTNPRTLIVIGRSTTLTEANREKLMTIQNTIPKLRILTYDDLLANVRANLERILGPLIICGDNVEIYFYKPESKHGQQV